MSFRHEALLYEGSDGFLAGTVPFIEEALAADAAVMVAVDPAKINLLRARLDGGNEVRFVDMPALGANPASIISAWHEYVSERPAGREVYGIGEPVWPERSADELAECYRHECLLNAAFAETPDFRLLCPYDTATLDPAVIEDAHVSHPVIVRDGEERPSPRWDDLAGLSELMGEALPEPGTKVRSLQFDSDSLPGVRREVARRAGEAGIDDALAAEIVLAVNELATNSSRYGGGGGELRIWNEADAVVYEVRDRGLIEDPLAGRFRPGPEAERGYGLWLVNQLCELVQLRSSESGTTVRLRARA